MKQTVRGRDNINVAGGDINISAVTLLHALEKAVTDSGEIPAAEKAGILEWIRRLIANPYVSAITPNVIAGAIKTYFSVKT